MSEESQVNRMDELLQKVASGDITPDEYKECMRTNHRAMYSRVARNGAISVFGLQKNGRPVTMYQDQWERLSVYIRDNSLDTFINENGERIQENRVTNTRGRTNQRRTSDNNSS
jgi:hypothetical protein